MLTDITDRQDELITKALKLLDNVQKQLPSREVPCKPELTELQEEIFKFNIDKIFPLVGEINTARDKKQENQSLCVRLMKSLFGALLMAQIVSFVIFGNNKPPKMKMP